MKRFAFRLQTLLDMKKRREEDLKRSLALKNGLIIRAVQRLGQGREALSNFQDRERENRLAAPTAQALRLSITYRYKLQRDIADSEREMTSLRREAQGVIQSLTEAKKESRALEILKEKKLLRWKRDNKREEQETLDDITQKEYIRKTRTSGAHAGS
jgi:flagellar FliJ protein